MPGGIVFPLLNLATGVSDALQFYDACQDPALDREVAPAFGTACRVHRAVLVGFSIAEAAMLASGCSSDSLYTLKEVEIVPRFLKAMIVDPISVGIKRDNTPQGIVRFIERGVFAPLMDFTRMVVVTTGYYEKHFLEMTPEEQEKATRRDYSDPYKWDAVKPINLEECKNNLDAATDVANAAAFLRIGAETEVVSKTFGVILHPFYTQLISYLMNGLAEGNLAQVPPLPNPQPAAPAPLQVQQLILALNNIQAADQLVIYSGELWRRLAELDLTVLPMIPNSLHEDSVLRRYECSIYHQPARYPLEDPIARGTYYDRHAIYRWIDEHGTSPVTRLPLTREDLIQLPDAVYITIEHRLSYHKDRINQLLEQIIHEEALELVASPQVQPAQDPAGEK